MRLDKQILHPINENPLIQCYRIHAYMMNIIGLFYPDFEKYVISNYLCLHNGKKNIRRNYLDFHLDNNFLNIEALFRDNSWFNIIQISDYKSEYYRTDDNLKNTILEYLQDGYYLIHNVNETCLTHVSRYRPLSRQSVSHNIAMMYGYSYDKNVFYMLDYDYRGCFGSSVVPSNEYFNSLFTTTCTNCLNFIKAKENLFFTFDFKRSCKLIKSYIQSENAYPNHEDYINNIFGYAGIERALNEMEENEVDVIHLRVMKEHKVLLLKYLIYIFNNNYMDNIQYIEDYKIISNAMSMIFMSVLKNMISGGDKRRYIDDYEKIRRLNERESVLLEKCLRDLVL